jgi:hypothetical protein
MTYVVIRFKIYALRTSPYKKNFAVVLCKGPLIIQSKLCALRTAPQTNKIYCHPVMNQSGYTI